MERWSGKVAVLTGASAGIGAKTVEALVRNGVIVVGLARRVERVRELATKLKDEKGRLHPIECDVTKESDILHAFDWINEELGGVDILVNNAGFSSSEMIIEGKTENFRKILDINVLAFAICSREAVKSMRKRNVEGHIIVVNSVLGHDAKMVTKPMSLLAASKYAVTGMTLSLRMELSSVNANIKVTSVSPGLVDTEMSASLGFSEELLNSLKANNIADAIIYVLGTPSNVQINELTVEALKKIS